MKFSYINNKWILRIVLILCVAFLILGIVQVCRFAFQPNQMDVGEGYTMYVAKLWANGQFNWYPDRQPYMTLIYGVIYPTIMKPFVLLFGPDLRIGRIYCLVATAVISVFIYMIARRYTKNRYIPFIAALLPMLHPGYREWITQARCDMVAIMFSVIGMYLAIRWQSDKRILWSIPLFLLAFFTKQTAVMGAGAICLFLLITNRKLFLIYAGILVVSGAAIILIGNALTNGQFFMQLWEYNKTVPFVWSWDRITGNYVFVFNPLALILLCVPIILLLKRTLYKQYSIPLLWLSITLVFTSILLFRKGAFINYGLELIIISGLYFALLIEQAKRLSIIITFLLVISQLLLCFSTNPVAMPDKLYAVKVSEVKDIIKDTQQPILTEHAGLVLSAGKTPYYEPFIYTNLESLGYFDENIIISDLNNQHLDYIVLRRPVEQRITGDDHLNQRVMEAISNNYQVVYLTSNSYYWYDFCVYQSKRLYEARLVETD